MTTAHIYSEGVLSGLRPGASRQVHRAPSSTLLPPNVAQERAFREDRRRPDVPLDRLRTLCAASLLFGFASAAQMFTTIAHASPRSDRGANGEQAVRESSGSEASAPSTESNGPRGQQQNVNQPLAPAFTLANPRGEMVASAYGSRKITMVHFWASWCVPCIREIPALNRLAARYEPLGAAVLAVAMSSGEAADLRQLERAYEIRHTVLLGTEELAAQFGGIPSFPTTYLVGKDGRILARLSGASEDIQRKIEDQLMAAIKSESTVSNPKVQ